MVKVKGYFRHALFNRWNDRQTSINDDKCTHTAHSHMCVFQARLRQRKACENAILKTPCN